MSDFNFPDANGKIVETQTSKSGLLHYNQPVTNTVEHVRGGYTVLLGGLNSLVADLKTASISEHHLNLATQIRVAVTDIVENAENLKEGDVAGKKFNKRLGQHLEWYDKHVIAPLSKVVGWKPDDTSAQETGQGEASPSTQSSGNKPDGMKETQKHFEDRISRGMLIHLPLCIREIETFRDQLLAAFCRGQLSVLVHESEKDPEGNDMWSSRGLELGSMGQGNTPEEAAESAANMAMWHLEDDIGMPRCELHNPSAIEDFDTFNGIETDMISTEPWHSFSKVVARQKPQEAPQEELAAQESG